MRYLVSTDWGRIGTQELTYTVAAMDQSIHYQTITVTVYENLEYYLYGMEGQKKVTVGSSFDPMEGITYDEKKLKSVTADVSALDTAKEGEYPVSYLLTDKKGHTQTAVRRVHVSASGSGSWDNSGSRDCTAGYRYCDYPDDRFINRGFRVAASQDVNR